MNVESTGYRDSVGGFHDSGVGWAPDNSYCGECNRQTCKSCPIWKWKQINLMSIKKQESNMR